MAANVRSTHLKRAPVTPVTESANTAHPLSYSLGVRMKFGDELEGLDLLPDGLVFRSPSPMMPGKMIELILCRGSILVDAMVVHSAPLNDESGGFAIHTRFHHVSEALHSLIREEVARLTGRPELVSE
jgi:hypothetical protein